MKNRSVLHGSILFATVASAAAISPACSSGNGSGGTGGGGQAPMSTSSQTATSTTGGGQGGTGGSGTGGATTGGGGASTGGGGSATGGGGGVPVNNDDYVYPVDSMVNGETFGDYAGDWWIWALGIDAATNPIFEGACDQNQSANVFYLAGNTGGASTRSCTVPSGTPIFFPILNVFTTTCTETGDCPADPDAELIDTVSTYYTQSPVSSMTLKIDGVSLSNLEQYYAQSGIWTDPRSGDPNTDVFYNQCTGPIGPNQCGVPVGTARDAAASGYWIMMKPLAPGSHVVHFVGHQQGFSLNVTYNLTVQ